MPVRPISPPRFRRYVIPIVLVWLASAAFRWWHFDERRVTSNIDASYHVLLTVRALDATPASIHHFLPIVSLGRPLDRDVPFGASIRAPDGIYYYTSFPPLGFIAPWAFFKVTTLAPTLQNLMAFNLLLHLGATLLLALLVAEAVAAIPMEDATRRVVIGLAVLSYLLNFEAQWSHGAVYWHHSLFQLAWLAQLVAAASVFRAMESQRPWRGADVVVLLVTAFLGPAIEWTGYLTTGVTAIVIWWQGRSAKQPAARALAGGMLLAAGTAGVAFITQFVAVVGLQPLLAALAERAEMRSAAHGSLSALAGGYVQSFGALLALVAATAAAYMAVIRRRPPRWVGGVLIIVTLPLVENLLLAEHATTYHFDRLKALVTCVVVVASLAVLLPPLLRDRLLFVWTAVVSFMLTRSPQARTSAVIPPLSSNDQLMRALHAAARPCAVFATNGEPRGWTELSMGANTYQSVPDLDSLRRIVAARGGCQGIYLRVALDAGESMYVWRSASLFDPATGRVVVIPGTSPRRARLRPDPSEATSEAALRTGSK